MAEAADSPAQHHRNRHGVCQRLVGEKREKEEHFLLLLSASGIALDEGSIA
jgi:hypothetical protein